MEPALRPELPTSIRALRARMRRPPWRLALVPFALGAAALFALFRPSPPPAADLPEYRGELVADGAIVVGTPRLAPGGRLEVRLRPVSQTGGRFAPVRAYFARDERVVVWRPQVGLDPEGTIRLTGSVGRELAERPGVWKVLVTAGAAAPEGEALVRALAEKSPGSGSWRAVTFEIDASPASP